MNKPMPRRAVRKPATNHGGRRFGAEILGGLICGGLVILLTGCFPAKKPLVILQGVPADGVLAYAADEISSFLGNRYAVLRDRGAGAEAGISLKTLDAPPAPAEKKK